MGAQEPESVNALVAPTDTKVSTDTLVQSIRLHASEPDARGETQHE
jgi:hypothetical protein